MVTPISQVSNEGGSLHHMSDSLVGKKLLLLAGADPHRKVVKAAQALGVYVIVADYLPIDEAPAKQIADEAWQIDVYDVDGLVKRCREERVDGVLNFCLDAPQKPYQQICEQLGFPCYGTKEQFAVLSDKNAFKAYCVDHGLLTIPSYSEEDLISGNVEYPVFIKPADGRGSRGQAICFKADEAVKALESAKNVSRDGVATIEKYLEGAQDFSISCFIINGVVYPIKIGDRYDGNKLDGMDRQHICTLSPTVQLDIFMEKTMPRIRRFISDLGIVYGALFIQGFIDNGEVYCYDPGLRLPGSDFDLITRDVTGFDAMKSAVNYALTGDPLSCYGDPRGAYNLRSGLGVILSIAAKPGIVGEISGIDNIIADSRISGVSIRHQVGDVIEKTGDTSQRIAEFVAYIPNRSHLQELLMFIYKHMRVNDEYGDNMIISKADYASGRLEVR